MSINIDLYQHFIDHVVFIMDEIKWIIWFVDIPSLI